MSGRYVEYLDRVTSGVRLMVRGKAIELFLADGTTGGIMTAGIADWTGILVSARRDQLAKLSQREETKSNGVYILLGDDPKAVENTWCYIGKTENFVERLRTHDQRKSGWDRVVIIASLQRSFNEGHWGYLEARLVEMAKQAERCSMPDNKQTPRLRKLSEAQQASAESFLDNVQLILPILGVNILRSTETVAESTAAPVVIKSPVFYLKSTRSGVDAQMQLVDGEFFVLKGSKTVPHWNVVRGTAAATISTYKALAARHQKLIDDGSIQTDGETGVLTRNVAFSSPSTAASVVSGFSSNGRQAWKTSDGQSFAEWEDSTTS